MGIAAPVIVREMSDWVKQGGGNSGIVGDAGHSYGFHVAADELPADDYSRVRDPNGSDGPYVNWNWACAGDFDHKNKTALRKKHADLLARLMKGQHPMICEFIGKPFADKPVYYWARWNGIKTLQKYTGAGHDHWSHISWYRSKANQPAYLWVPSPIPRPTLHRVWPSYMPKGEYFGLISGPPQSHGGYYAKEKPDILAIQKRVKALGYSPGTLDGIFGGATKTAVSKWQKARYPGVTTRFGEVWNDDWLRLFTYV